MNIGDEVNIRAKVVNVEVRPDGEAVQVEVQDFLSCEGVGRQKPFDRPVRLWIQPTDRPDLAAK